MSTETTDTTTSTTTPVAVKDNEFTQSEQELIATTLTELCIGAKCISRLEIYTTLADDFKRLGETKFQTILSKSIDDNLFPDFTTRRGRNGGVCKVGAFDEIEKNKAEKDSKVIKTPVEIDGQPRMVKSRAKKLHDFVSIVLCGTEDNDGKIKIEGKGYNIEDIGIFNRYVSMLEG
jgi:hypothetical protein